LGLHATTGFENPLVEMKEKGKVEKAAAKALVTEKLAVTAISTT